MARTGLDERMENLEHRVTSVEQILPTLATKADLAAAIEPLATKAELQAVKAELRAEIREEGERTRRYFDVVSESNRDYIRILAEGVANSNQRMEAIYVELKQANSHLDRRVTTLEAARQRRR